MVKKYGVTETGFVKKTFNEILNDLHDHARHSFGRDVDLTPGSPIKVYIDMTAAQFRGLWNELNSCYDAGFLDTATGYSLDNLGKLVGAERNLGIYATGYVTFFRNTRLPTGSPRIILAGTKLSTATIRPTEYVTTEAVYFQPTITGEVYTMLEVGYSIDTINYIYTIQGIYDSLGENYINDVTFSGRTITFADPVEEGTIFFIDYTPLSVTAPIVAINNGADSNVAANTITIMDSPVDFIHYVGNENGIDSGADVESDSHFRNTIIGATQAVGKATTNALSYYIGKVSNVKNVLIEDPLRTTTTETIKGLGTGSIFVTHNPIMSVISITGSVGGIYALEGFDAQTGELTLATLDTLNEDITVVYVYAEPGKIKIYVEGGTTGDEFTEDTIVYAIEHTRAAGIQSIGYDTDDSTACGSPTAKFSWFYRPNVALIDLTLEVYFDAETELTPAAKLIVLTQAQDNATDYINELDLTDKLYRNKILQLVIGSNVDIIDAQLIGWKLNNEAMPVSDIYIHAGEMDILTAQNIVITEAV